MADVVRTTLGPRGMDKLMHTERAVTVSNDGATIMKTLDIVHPAAKTLVDISLAQDAEVGAGKWRGHLLLGLSCWRWRDGCPSRPVVPPSGRAVDGLAECAPALRAGKHRAQQSGVCRLACRPPRVRCMPPCHALQVGDGTTTVVLLAAEFLKECKAFVEEGVHPQASRGWGRGCRWKLLPAQIAAAEAVASQGGR